jgi:thiol-disulfide isomerase/thioredoxin
MRVKNNICILLLLLFPLLAAAEKTSGPPVGETAPNLIGRTLDDQTYRLKVDKGKPKVINFFWVECKPCVQEMPELAKLEKQYTGVKFISVHTRDESHATVLKFIESLPAAPSNIVLTSGGVQQTFQYRGLPHTIVLDSNNVVLLNLSGYTAANMQRLVKALQAIPRT